MKTPLIIGLVLAGLTACGPMQSNNRLADAAQNLLSRGGAQESAAATPASAELNREQIEAAPVDLLRVSYIDFGATAVLVRAGDNAGKTTWLSGDGRGATFKGGLLIGTRGLGDDLMGADIDAAIASLNGGGNHLRTLDFLNGLSQIERVQFSCTTTVEGSEELTIFERTYQTSIIEELCNSDIGAFKNTYWRDANGVIWQSRQFISVGAGYLGYQRL